jgi:hypothetical protein
MLVSSNEVDGVAALRHDGNALMEELKATEMPPIFSRNAPVEVEYSEMNLFHHRHYDSKDNFIHLQNPITKESGTRRLYIFKALRQFSHSKHGR